MDQRQRLAIIDKLTNKYFRKLANSFYKNHDSDKFIYVNKYHPKFKNAKDTAEKMFSNIISREDEYDIITKENDSDKLQGLNIYANELGYKLSTLAPFLRDMAKSFIERHEALMEKMTKDKNYGYTPNADNEIYFARWRKEILWSNQLIDLLDNANNI